jgi:hypothetical protein
MGSIAHIGDENRGQTTIIKHRYSWSVPVEKIEVTGHYDNRLGTFDAASQGTTSGRVRSSKTTACESKATTLAYGRVAYRISPAWKVSLDGFNLFDRKASDIEYFYRSRLPGEPAGGVKTCTSIRSSRAPSV